MCLHVLTRTNGEASWADADNSADGVSDASAGEMSVVLLLLVVMLLLLLLLLVVLLLRVACSLLVAIACRTLLTLQRTHSGRAEQASEVQHTCCLSRQCTAWHITCDLI